MAFRIFEFECSNGHRIEKLVHHEQELLICEDCGADSKRQISATRFVLDGCSGDYPTAADAWVRKREEKQRQEVKKST